MSNLEPSGPSQPTLDQSYTAKGNPAQTDSAEKAAASANAHAQHSGDQRIPTKQTSGSDEATPSSLGYGVRGAPPGEEARGKTNSDVGRSNENEGEQMRAPGEGEIADANDDKPGATGSEKSLTSDLDRKKAEQAPMRQAAKEERKEHVDVAGVLADRGGPANPVDKGNYPNSGD